MAANTTLPVIPRGMNPFRIPNPVEINCDLGDFAKPTDFDASTWPKYFQQRILYALTAPNFTPSQVVAVMTVNALAPGEAAAYDRSKTLPGSSC